MTVVIAQDAIHQFGNLPPGIKGRFRPFYFFLVECYTLLKIHKCLAIIPLTKPKMSFRRLIF
jgi:hypothetical protein